MGFKFEKWSEGNRRLVHPSQIDVFNAIIIPSLIALVKQSLPLQIQMKNND